LEPASKACFCKAGTENKTAPPVAVQGLHFQAGAQRKTERSEGNPAVVTTNYQGVKNSVSSFLISMSVAVGVTKKSLKGVF
jgi:hypothetical protein